MDSRKKQGEAAMVDKSTLTAVLAMSLVLAAPAAAADKATAVLKDSKGNEVGKAELTATPNGVLISLDLTAVPAGEHAFHIHAVGKCEPPDFKSAGPHFNPDEKKHGLINPEGPHAGDIPNLYVPSDGKLHVEMLNQMVTLDEKAALLDQDGSALVIHVGVDDYVSDPAGNAGDRLACGVVIP
jgi:Cu-Zn family superoxide dismutase